MLEYNLSCYNKKTLKYSNSKKKEVKPELLFHKIKEYRLLLFSSDFPRMSSPSA